MNDDHHTGDHVSYDVSSSPLESRLTRMGAESVEVSTARLGGIENRVRASMVAEESIEPRRGHARVVPAATVGSVRDRSRVRRIALVAAAFVAIVVLSIAAIGAGDDPLVIAAAQEVVVVLPDGGTMMATSGTEVPDDSLLEVAGFVEVDGRRYGPGRYRVDDGRLVPIANDAAPVVGTDPDAAGSTIDRERDPDRVPESAPTRPAPRGPSTSRPPVSSPPSTRPAAIEPPATRTATTAPSRTTVPASTTPERPATTTSAPPPTRSPVTAPPTTIVRTTTTTTTPTSTTIVVRTRPRAAEPPREG